jgi:3-oxoacyl-[acyl-carrier protein] reductase
MGLEGAFRVDGQVAVVTGAASGIGEATALVLAQAGARVVAGDIDYEGASQTAKAISEAGGQAVAVAVDVRSKEQVDALADRAAEEFGQLDVMCNVAGVGNNAIVADVTEAELDRVIGVNLKGVFFGCQAALRHMAPRHSGNIVNVSSSGIDTPYPGLSVYGMTKSAIAFLSMTLAAEVGPLGIRVNAIAPGATESNFSRYRLLDEHGNLDPEKKAAWDQLMAQSSPLGLIGEPVDQAMMILYLVSPAGRFATGNIFRVNGGTSRSW